MVRILRAFAWLRWRMLINSLEKTGARDRLERFSIAMERLGPIMAGVIMIPSTIVLAALAGAGGFSLGRGDQSSLLFAAIRYVLFFGPIASIKSPLHGEQSLSECPAGYDASPDTDVKGLRAETHGDTHHAGRPQNRRDRDTDFRQDQHAGDARDQNAGDVP